MTAPALSRRLRAAADEICAVAAALRERAPELRGIADWLEAVCVAVHEVAGKLEERHQR